MRTQRHNLVLAIYPNTRGFAFVLFEGPLAPVDWATIEMRGKRKNRRCLRAISRLFGRYGPDALVLQNTGAGGTRRARRIHELNEAIQVLAETQGISVFAYSQEQVRERFSHRGFPTKHRIAEAIAKHVPAFERHLPPNRKPWMSEDERMSLFDAAALALTFFQVDGSPSQQAA